MDVPGQIIYSSLDDLTVSSLSRGFNCYNLSNHTLDQPGAADLSSELC
jgi:hypothetical protein